MMRLPAALGFAVVLALGGPAAAQVVDDVGGEAGVATYVDQMDTVIWSPHAHARADAPGDVEVGVGWKADVITSASVDVVTAATSRMEETRHELGLTARREDLVPDLDVDASYAYSFENDADAHVLAAGAVRSFAADAWQAGVRYSLSLNRLGVNEEPRSARRPLAVHGADFTLTRVLDRRTLIGIGVSLYYLDGYQASPYRRVPILSGPDLRGAMWVEEQVPDRRFRQALLVRGRRVLGARWVAAAEARAYVDDWGVLAATVRLDQVAELGAAFTLRMHQRLGVQSGAEFYQRAYVDEMTYRTRDRRLSPHLNALAGAALVRELPGMGSLGEVDLFLRGDVLLWRFAEYDAPVLDPTGGADLEPLGTVLGGILQLGVEVRP